MVVCFGLKMRSRLKEGGSVAAQWRVVRGREAVIRKVMCAGEGGDNKESVARVKAGMHARATCSCNLHALLAVAPITPGSL